MRIKVMAGIALAAASVGCVRELTGPRVAPGASPSPEVAWTPPPSVAAEQAPAARTAEIPTDLLATSRNWTLADLVDLGLRNSPKTRAAWAAARSSAAALGSQKGSYYPTIGATASLDTVRGTAVAGQFSFQQGSYDGSLNLTYLLLDFGGRSARVEMARQALMAADWTHNAAILDVMLDVQRAYYQYLFFKALEESQQTGLKEAQGSLDAATGRREAGVATIAEVLQAKTVLSQARLALETTEGQIQTIRGVLATAVGLPANTPYDVEIPAAGLEHPELPVVEEQVDRLIEQAQAMRPDLAAAKTQVLAAEARIKDVRSEALPSLVTNWNGGAVFYTGKGSGQTIYNGELLLRIPIFNGLSHQYDMARARADAEVARARLDALSQDVVSQVWSSYFAHKTAATRVETSRDLLDSASQSYEVTKARYSAGVGSILDLLTSQTALDSARANQAQAEADWHLSLAQLAHDTGTLSASGEAATKGGP